MKHCIVFIILIFISVFFSSAQAGNPTHSTKSLLSKRKNILKRFKLEHMGIEYDTLVDLNFDGKKDYMIGYYGECGNGIKNRIEVYLYSGKRNNYIRSDQLSGLPNPTFYLRRKKITSFYMAGSGSGCSLKWINDKWATTMQFDVDGTANEGDSVAWKINYPLLHKKKIIIAPYLMIPPKNILETSVTLDSYSPFSR